jgi:nucleoside-triphosphatase THEP1
MARVLWLTGLLALLDRQCTIVGTIARSGGGLIADLKQRSGSILWEVTRDNRGEMPARVLGWLRRTD